MRVAIIGSRTITKDISAYIPKEMTELISGGALGVDSLAESYANENMIPKLIIKPQYEIHGKKAPQLRNKIIVDAADLVVVIWDGKSRGTKYAIDYAKKTGKPIKIYIFNNEK